MGTFLLIAVALIRRWQQIRFARHVHTLHHRYRPVLARLLSGARSAGGIEALRELPLADLELLFDPLFSQRKLTERQLVFLEALCADLGLIALWQSRSAAGHTATPLYSGDGTPGNHPGGAAGRYLLRAKSIRNLGKLRHRPSWPLLVNAVDDRHPDIQLLALRSLGAMGAPESFPFLRERLHAVVQRESTSPPLAGLQAAMVSFDLSCAPALLPSLRHPDRHLRLHAMEILRTMVGREAARQPRLILIQELLSPPVVDLLLTVLAVDLSAEVRARVADVIVFVADARATSVLHDLLIDRQWFVRLHTVRALSQWRQTTKPQHLEVGDCLHDPHWRVRETAIQTLISFGQKGRDHLYKHFLTSPDHNTRAQIVEVIERTGLMSVLVEEYSTGTKGVEALMVEYLASDTAPMGISGVLRTLEPESRKRFLDRFLPYAEATMRFPEETHTEMGSSLSLQQILEFPPHLAA
jgi:HEAT repeat protein